MEGGERRLRLHDSGHPAEERRDWKSVKPMVRDSARTGRGQDHRAAQSDGSRVENLDMKEPPSFLRETSVAESPGWTGVRLGPQ